MGIRVNELVLTGARKVELATNEAEPGEGDIVVRNRYSLISPGTELALFTGTHIGFSDPEITWARYPLKPGYASVGRVETVGSGVGGFRPGDEVLHYKTHADLSILRPGQDLIFRRPAGLDPREALFARFGQIAYTAVAASQKKEGPVLVLGGGIVGNLCAQLFRSRRNRRATIVDLSPSRIALARRCGLDAVAASAGKTLSESLKEAAVSGTWPTIVEATGAPSLVSEALEAADRLGEVILLGSTRGKVELDVYKRIHRKALSLIGAHESRYPLLDSGWGEPSHEAFGRDLLSLLSDGGIKVGGFITDTVAPTEVQAAYEMLLADPDGHLGVLIAWQGRKE